MRIDLSADVGEGDDDLAIFSLVSSVNVACGAHAGDEETIERSVAEAARLGIAVGAHPGYADREGFGRRALDVEPGALSRSIVEQVRALAAVAERHGVRLAHVKPHGALYNQAAIDPALAGVVAGAVREAGVSLRLVGLAGSAMVEAARTLGVPFTAEAFADRRYAPDGTLAPRTEAGAVIDDPLAAASQALAIVLGEPVHATDGALLPVAAESICLHADTPGAIVIAGEVRTALTAAGVAIRPVS